MSLRFIRDELLDLAGTLADTQTRLDHLVEQLDEREEELERSLREAVNSAKWLRAQNEDLEHRLNSHKPEIKRALDAREAAFRRLKHARKVIRDLLDERQDMSSPRRGPLTHEEIEEALYGDDVSPADENLSSSSDTNRTPRGAGTGSQSPMEGSNTPKPSSLSKSGLSLFSPILQGRSARLSPVKSPFLQNTPPSGGSSNLIRLSPTSKNSPEIHFKKPPGSASIRKGPFTLEKLQSYLGLGNDTMDSLRSLHSPSEMKMRMHIVQLDTEQSAAFLYEPLFVETGEKSYAIYWSRPATNKALEQEILRHKERDPVFHTFTYPLKEKAWFYIGAHHWSVVDTLGDLWPLEGKNRTTMIRKLSQGTRGEVGEEEMGRMLDSGELQQMSIEIVGVVDTKVSTDFAQNHLGRSPKHQLKSRNVGSVQLE